MIQLRYESVMDNKQLTKKGGQMAKANVLQEIVLDNKLQNQTKKRRPNG